MRDLIAGEMVGQRRTAGPAWGSLGGRIIGNAAFDHALGMGMLGLEVFQRQFELIGLGGKAFRGLAELHAPQASQLHLELLDLQRRQLDRVLRRLQLLAGLTMGGLLGGQRLL